MAVIVPAKDEGRYIAATIRACRAIPHVDLVLVVDDGSTDDTQHVARAAGAVVVRHSVNRGKASAMETGASVVSMRDLPDAPPRALLFVDADLQDSAVGLAPLVEAVLTGETDCAIAVLPPQQGAGGKGRVVRLARGAIESATGWVSTQPLSGQRCLTRRAYETAQPLARGWGVEVGMTIDLLVAGLTIQEIPCDVSHRASGKDIAGAMHRARQYRDVAMAVTGRKSRRHSVPHSRRAAAAESQQPGRPYQAWAPRPARRTVPDDATSPAARHPGGPPSPEATAETPPSPDSPPSPPTPGSAPSPGLATSPTTPD
ncbi:Glucosyl-3-phosphoglycerate synthase [Actinomycetales bacterium JB111]|nr:Glucosyl-3-phosphoglycerate synthase [Actinomycetales bacterium JB111]